MKWGWNWVGTDFFITNFYKALIETPTKQNKTEKCFPIQTTWNVFCRRQSIIIQIQTWPVYRVNTQCHEKSHGILMELLDLGFNTSPDTHTAPPTACCWVQSCVGSKGNLPPKTIWITHPAPSLMVIRLQLGIFREFFTAIS